jgi:hypothetical protein
MGSQGNLQLVAQGEVFEDQVGVASKDRVDQAKDVLEEFDPRGRASSGLSEPLPSPITSPASAERRSGPPRSHFASPLGDDGRS